MVRKPSYLTLIAAGGINTQSSEMAQICTSETKFKSLISSCTLDKALGNSSMQGASLGGIGSDPVFDR